MDITFYLSIISVGVSVISVLYTFLTNRDRFLISSSERNSILNWYEDVNRILVEMKCEARENKAIEKEKLHELSALIDLGRFYFPNTKDKIGLDKPAAYRGFRTVVIDLLIYAYEIGHFMPITPYSDHLEIIQRQFTSELYQLVNPHKYNSHLKKITYFKVMNDKATFENFIACQDPYNFKFTNEE